MLLTIAISFASIAAVLAGNTTCIQQDITWWNAAGGESPCLEYQRLMQICNTDFQMYNTAYPPLYNPCNNVGCCCNTIAYSLWSACWACQWGTPYPSNNPATYGTFLGAGLVGSTGVLCPNGLDIGVLPDEYAEGLKIDPIPEWAFISIADTGSVWNYTLAQANATLELAFSSSIPAISMQSTLSVASTASLASASAASALAAASHKSSHAGLIAGAVIAVIGSLAVIFGAALIFWFRRRRRSGVREVDNTAEAAGQIEPFMAATPWNHSVPNPAAASTSYLPHPSTFPSESNHQPGSGWNGNPNTSQYAIAGSKAELLAHQEARGQASSSQSHSDRRITSADFSEGGLSSIVPPSGTTREQDAGVSFGDSGADVVLPPLYRQEWNDRRS